jgi:CelD/BcsL family acetyltransferase involved in cellulose biosynthesis
MRVVQLMGNDHTPRAGLIVASPSCEVPGELCAEVCGAVLDAIGALREGWDVVLLSQLAEGSTARQLQEFAQKKSLSTGVWRSVASPRLRLNGTWESYLASLRPKQRANLRNRINRLRKTGPLALEEVRGGPALQAALDDGLRLEGAAWKGLEGTSIASSPLTSRFYRRFAESAAAQGWLSLLFLTVGGERIAFCYALRFAGTLHLLKMGYDPQYSAASPSQVLCALIIEEATRHGDRCIDFLGDDEPWKREWTAEVQAHSWLYLFRPGLKTWSLRRAKFTLAPLVRDRLLPLLARGGRSGATRQPAQSPAPEAGSP